MTEVFVQISIIISIVFVVSLVMRLLRQPLIIGYIISGVIIGPFFLNIISVNETIQLFSDFGIAFLLFIVGLHLSPKVIKEVGKISFITGVGQVLFTSLFGYFIALAFGFSPLTSVYIAIALTFSSTIIITKLLSDRGDLDSLYGKISIGFLLVQDFIAILILIIVSSLSSGSNLVSSVGFTILKGVILTALIILISIFVLPKTQKFFARSQELLFVFAITWGLGLASLFYYAGLSLEVGALIAGVVLSVSPYSLEISSKLKPLRDFFLISFFLIIGSNMVLAGFSDIIIPALVFSLFILIGNPLIVMILMGLFGYTKRIGFMAGLTVAQISEFSLILIALGIKVGHLSPEILSFVTFIGLFTIAGSTYMIIYSNSIYSKLSKYLDIFERKGPKKESKIKTNYGAILFGYNRIGFGILMALKKLKMKYLVVDFNPDIVQDLKKIKIPCVYGDAYDIDFLDELSLNKVKIVISTIPDFETNVLLVEAVKKVNAKAIIIARAHQIKDALELYEKGANYVLTPHFLGGEYVSKMILDFNIGEEDYKKEKKKHLKMLEEMNKRGKKYPEVERG